MRILIVGIGALGGMIATRALRAGVEVCLATRTEASAKILRCGLKVSGVGGEASAVPPRVAVIEDYEPQEKFDLILLATKAHDAVKSAPALIHLLTPRGVLLPIQNGAVAQMLADRLGSGRVIGGSPISGRPWSSPGSMNNETPAICSLASWQEAPVSASSPSRRP